MNQKIENRGDFLLKKWLDGSITWQEERELEQLAKGDPMLADALEGFRVMPEGQHTKAVERLKAKLHDLKDRRRRGLIFYLPRVAAAAAIIATLAFGIQYFIGNVSQKSAVAQVEQPTRRDEQQETSNEQQAASSKESNDLVLENKEANRSTARDQITAPQLPAIEHTRIAPLSDTASTVPDAESSALAAEEKPTESQKEQAKTMSESPQLQKPGVARSVTPSTVFIPERIIIGKLTDIKGKPLVGVVVSIDGKDTGTTTSLSGDFTLPIPAETKELVFSYTGFQTTAVPIGRKDTVNVQLKEDAQALSEVVVSGYSARDTKARKEDAATKKTEALQGKTQGIQTVQLPGPQGGFDKLERYIRNNLRYPKAAKDAKIEGKVVVEFTILPNGSLTDFTIVESLGYGLDEEAIRLLREGPKWDMRNKVLKRDTASYSIEFKLKK